jgi:hypothetical protein
MVKRLEVPETWNLPISLVITAFVGLAVIVHLVR